MRALISKQSGRVEYSKPDFAVAGKSGSVGIGEWFGTGMAVGIQESLSENTIEAFNQPVIGKLGSYNGKWEHLRKSANPDDFPSPIGTFALKSAKSLFHVTAVGYPGGDPNTLYSQNYDMGVTDTVMYCYLFTGVTGPGGFKIPTTGGVLRTENLPTETMHFGTSNGSQGFGDIARNWGGVGPPWQGGIHLGHDYETNPNPPPPTIIARHHEGVSVEYPSLCINTWLATGFAVALDGMDEASYAPKGSRCGVFMPVILRFLALRRRRAKSSLGVVTVQPTIS